jgi:hypothetical protein
MKVMMMTVQATREPVTRRTVNRSKESLNSDHSVTSPPAGAAVEAGGVVPVGWAIAHAAHAARATPAEGDPEGAAAARAHERTGRGGLVHRPHSTLRPPQHPARSRPVGARLAARHSRPGGRLVLQGRIVVQVPRLDIPAEAIRTGEPSVQVGEAAFVVANGKSGCRAGQACRDRAAR